MRQATRKSIRFWLLLLLCGSGIVLASFELAPEILQKIATHYGEAGRKRVEQWQQQMPLAMQATDLEKLTTVNNFFNKNLSFTDDIKLWHLKDYWATPLECLAKGAGDCEDYAIAKYFTLKELGISDDKMRITYVKAIRLNQAHMVLTYFENPRAEPLVLDNLLAEIKPASARDDLLPIYSFNGSGLWLAKAKGSGQRVGDAERLNLWQELLQRINNNVLQ